MRHNSRKLVLILAALLTVLAICGGGTPRQGADSNVSGSAQSTINVVDS